MSYGATGKSALVVTSGLFHDAVIVRLEGELDVYAVPLLREHLRRVWAAPVTPYLILDLRGIAFCDSEAMGELVGVLQRCERQGTRLLLGGVGGVMERVLSITGLRNAFEVYDDWEDALRHAVAAPPPSPA